MKIKNKNLISNFCTFFSRKTYSRNLRYARRGWRATLNLLKIRPPSHGAGESLSSCSLRVLCILRRCYSPPCPDIPSRVLLAAHFPVFQEPNTPHPYRPDYPPLAISATRPVRAIHRTLRGGLYWRAAPTLSSFFLCRCVLTICEPRALETRLDDVG